jgi:hypothetical protein
MTDQQCEEMYQKILDILRHHQLSDLIDGINEEIAEGKIIEDSVQTFKEDFAAKQNSLPAFESLQVDLKPASKIVFSTVAPYTPRERLEILIDVLEQALITPTAIEIYLQQDFLAKHGLQALVFRSEDGENVKKIYGQDQTLQSRKASMEQLRLALVQVRKAL